MKAYKLKRTVVGILLVILTLGFCLIGTGAAKGDGMGQPPTDRQGFGGRGGQQGFDGQTPPDFDAENAPDGFTGFGGRGQFCPEGQSGDGENAFGGRGQRGFGHGGFDRDGGVRQAIEALEDGETKTKLLSLLDEVQNAMQALRQADEASWNEAEAAVQAAREALDAALKEAGIENSTTPPEPPEGMEGTEPPEKPAGEEGMTPPEKPEGEGPDLGNLSEEQIQNLFQRFMTLFDGTNSTGKT